MMDEAIIKFIKKQTCVSICCNDDTGEPYCFTCFYVFNAEDGLLYFKSAPNSHHYALLKKYPKVAGTILPDKISKLNTSGVQLQGEIITEADAQASRASGNYHKKIPIAIAVKGDVFTVRLDTIKMTKSYLGTWKKLGWSRNQDLQD